MERKIDLIDEQFQELRKKYHYLYKKSEASCIKIFGTIFFCKDEIKDNFEIEITVTYQYPEKIPVVRETKGRIPKTYHHNGDFFCLETPFNVWKIFRRNETLLNFIDNLLLPYLLIFSKFERSGNSSIQHAHGAIGVLDDYKIHFHTEDPLIVLNILKILSEKSYRGHQTCFCGSGKRIRDCHGQWVLSILGDKRFKNYNFMQDFLEIGCQLKKDNILSDISMFQTKKIKKYINEIKENPDLKWDY